MSPRSTGLCEKSKAEFSVDCFQVERVIEGLVDSHRTARVVIFLVIHVEIVFRVLRGTENRVPAGTFVWITSDAVSTEQLTSVSHLFRGGITTQPSGGIYEPFHKHFKSRTLVGKPL